VFTLQSDQKENKSQQALQIIIGHVVAESYTNKRAQFVVSLIVYFIMDKIYKVNRSSILQERKIEVYLANCYQITIHREKNIKLTTV
jgi:hypothetical protein